MPGARLHVANRRAALRRPRRGLLDHFADWLDYPPCHETEVESTAFTQRYQLRLADEQDDLYSPNELFTEQAKLLPGTAVNQSANLLYRNVNASATHTFSPTHRMTATTSFSTKPALPSGAALA